MNKVRTWMSALCILTLLAVLFSGCSSNEGGNASAPSGGAAAGAGDAKVTLRFSWWGSEDRHKALLEAIQLYMSEHPNVTIEAEYGGFDGYYQKLVTQFAGGTAPDLTPLSVDWIDDIAVKGDLVLDLYSQQSNIQLDAFNKEFLEKYAVYNKKLVGLPMGVNGMVAIYNQDFYKKFNIPEDTTWDWNAMYEIGKRVHQQDPNAYLLASLDFRGFLQPYVRQKTGKQWIQDDKTIGFDEAVLTDALTYYKKMLDEGVIQPISESSLYPDISQNIAWQKGNIGLVFGLASTITKLKAQIPGLDVTMYPVPADAKESAVLVNPSNPLAINKATKYPEEAAKFASWLLTSPESAMILRDVYSVPPVEKNAQALADSKKIDATVTKAVEIALKRPGNPINGISSNQELAKLAEDILQQVGFGQQTPAKAAQEMIKRMNEKLKTIK